ncbi:hypothetical protein PR001_g14583 [Phytophthora rubi]|nr:hypothetical protein PR001_g14583 [Phytophthora rubi]
MIGIVAAPQRITAHLHAARHIWAPVLHDYYSPSWLLAEYSAQTTPVSVHPIFELGFVHDHPSSRLLWWTDARRQMELLFPHIYGASTGWRRYPTLSAACEDWARCITANGRVDGSNPPFYVFNNARVFGSSGNGTAYLGRPWRPYSRVVWQNSEFSDVIHPDGWQEWPNDNNTANVYYKEFNNTGVGAATDKRVSFSGVLDAAVPITQILGENYPNEWYVDTNFL